MVDSLEAPEVAELLRANPERILLLDVREDDERETARIDPSVHIRMSEIAKRVGELPTDRRLIVYCHMGGRSQMVAGFLEGHGFTAVANLEGGIDAWSRLVDPKVPRY